MKKEKRDRIGVFPGPEIIDYNTRLQVISKYSPPRQFKSYKSEHKKSIIQSEIVFF